MAANAALKDVPNEVEDLNGPESMDDRLALMKMMIYVAEELERLGCLSAAKHVRMGLHRLQAGLA